MITGVRKVHPFVHGSEPHNGAESNISTSILQNRKKGGSYTYMKTRLLTQTLKWQAKVRARLTKDLQHLECQYEDLSRHTFVAPLCRNDDLSRHLSSIYQ